MSPELQLRLLQDLEPEVARWRRRTMLLASVVLHAIFIGLLLVSPQIFRRGAEMMGISLQPRKTQTTYLFLPPDLLKRLKEPPPDTGNLSDKNRRAQGHSPVIDPNGLRMPYSRGNTPLPDIAGGGKPSPPPPAPPPAGPATPAPSNAPAPPAPKKESNEEARLRLMDVPAQPEGGGDSRLRLPQSTPAEAIEQARQAAARGRSSGSGGPGNGISQFQNFHPNFSTEAPLILSDTRGVDFGPYLARIVYIVRNNWYQVIPESARLGEKGRVAIVFEILKDGSVPELRVVASSGSEPLDRAALAGIRASIPFPPLPEEFTGNHLVLQFIFLYNIGLTN